MANPQPLENDYTYESSGLDSFFTRQQDRASLLEESSAAGSDSGLNFDNLQIDGAFGDTLRIGRIFINGSDGNIIVNDGENDRVLIGFSPDSF